MLLQSKRPHPRFWMKGGKTKRKNRVKWKKGVGDIGQNVTYLPYVCILITCGGGGGTCKTHRERGMFNPPPKKTNRNPGIPHLPNFFEYAPPIPTLVNQQSREICEYLIHLSIITSIHSSIHPSIHQCAESWDPNIDINQGKYRTR